jgi:hypothetical protein
VPSSLESPNREEATDVNELLRNLSELVKVRDERIAYWASAGIERLAALRAAAANAGFVHWNLLNTAPLATGRDLKGTYQTLISLLGQLASSLRTIQSWQGLDPKAARAASEVDEAWQALKDRAAA